MSACFLLIHSLDEARYSGVRLNEQGQVEAALPACTLEEFQTLQHNALRTWVVLPTSMCSLHELEFPWLAENKARQAIPYALEDKLAQPVSQLHFAWDKAHYCEGKYQIVAVDKLFVLAVIEQLNVAQVEFDCITLDWFALQAQEVVLTDAGLLVRGDTFNGALVMPHALQMVVELPAPTACYAFSGIEFPYREWAWAEVDEPFDHWVSRRLINEQPINLCQGALQRKNNKHEVKYWYYGGFVCLGLWLVSLVLTNALLAYRLKGDIHVLDERIEVIYREFFPEAQRVISPKFRISQLLQSSRTPAENALQQLLNKLASASQGMQVNIEQVHFQNQKLTITLISSHFDALDRLQRRLKQAQVQVKQTQAVSRDQKIVATLELAL